MAWYGYRRSVPQASSPAPHPARSQEVLGNSRELPGAPESSRELRRVSGSSGELWRASGSSG
eukprot:9474876-Alexandrium_andersonii.AAC.1